ncbi:MAG: NAD(P)-dependent glycerol-3-phosphate dehydrogenase [Spirochaetales bacterium]|nr:NAD(P)-dependent glycerol-3-phosphate dehydrogenase [Spirochaetales bacterium]
MKNPKGTGIMNAGAWGTAIARVLGSKGEPVVLWDPLAEVVDEINSDHRNSRFLPGVDLPETVRAVTDPAEAAAGKEYILLATPSPYLTEVTKNLAVQPEVREGRPLIGVLSKGFLPGPDGPKLILDMMEGYLPGFYRNNLVYISGPSHAEEVSRGKITGLISACVNGKNSIRIRELLAGRNLLIYSSLDVKGVQVCGAVKNVIAIAFGILDALTAITDSFGDNTESLLLAAGLAEIQLLGTSLGSRHPETFTSIAGVGDLDVTCRSRYGRNRRFGKEIITKDLLQDFKNIKDLTANLKDLGYLPEGVYACGYTRSLAAKHGLKLPICEAVYRILNKEADPLDIIRKVIPVMI